MGLILLPILAKPTLLSLVPEGPCRRVSASPGSQTVLAYPQCGPEADTAPPAFMLLLWRKSSR